MKKFFMFLAVAGVMAFSANVASAQEDQTAAPATEETAVAAPAELSAADMLKGQEIPLHQALKTKFIEGGAGFMSLIIICLIIGLALSVERILYLTFSKVNAKKLVAKIEEALAKGGIEEAKKVCRETRGPVASIFYQGLLRYDQGIDVVEKTVVSYGSVQMSEMENGLSWISLFIALAPSLGFLGNAIVHGYPENFGKIVMKLRIREGNILEVVVKDWGVGIADVEQARKPLFTTGNDERSGMGFTIMESFMDTLRVRSVPQKGTTVTMRKRISTRMGERK